MLCSILKAVCFLVLCDAVNFGIDPIPSGLRAVLQILIPLTYKGSLCRSEQCVMIY